MTKERNKDDEVRRMVEGVVGKAFDMAKTMAVVGIKGVFAAKDVSDKVESGEAEEKLKQGAAEIEKVFANGMKMAKRGARRLVNELLADEKKPKKK